MNTIYSALTIPMQARTRVDVFQDIFLVFLGLGALVGVVVVLYTLYNAYKYRDVGEPDDDEDLPTVGELPTGGKGGKKLFLSFGLSAIIVISLVIWTYGMLLYVEDGPQENPEDAIDIEVQGQAFSWTFNYENGISNPSEMVIPAETPVWIEVTSVDVWHTFGITDLRVKADAIPGEVDETWFMADEPGNYTAECYELCGTGHSGMTADVTVLPQDEYETWLDDQLTMTITLEDENETRVTEGYELALEHQNNSEFDEDLSFTYTADEFENGSITIDEIEQGGTYNVTITSTDGEFDDVEETLEFDGQTDETFTVETGAAEDGGDGGDAENETQSDQNDDDTDDESDGGTESNGDGGGGE